MRILPIGLSIALMAGASEAAAQNRPAAFPTLKIATEWQVGVPGAPLVSGPVLRLAPSHHHALKGVLMGALVGGAGGWLFYNATCEAVNNQCYESRVRFVLIGGAVGGALGGVIGSLSE